MSKDFDIVHLDEEDFPDSEEQMTVIGIGGVICEECHFHASASGFFDFENQKVLSRTCPSCGGTIGFVVEHKSTEYVN